MISVVFGGSIILLPEYDTTIYVSFTGFTFDSTSSPSSYEYEKRRPKRAFEALLVVVLLTASCSPPPTDVVVVVLLLPVVEADTKVVVDAKIIVSVKRVAAAVIARYVLFIGGI